MTSVLAATMHVIHKLQASAKPLCPKQVCRDIELYAKKASFGSFLLLSEFLGLWLTNFLKSGCPLGRGGQYEL